MNHKLLLALLALALLSALGWVCSVLLDDTSRASALADGPLPGLAQRLEPGSELTASEHAAPSARTESAVAPIASQGVLIATEPLATIDPSHTVVMGRIVDSQQQPLAGARVEIGASLGKSWSLSDARTSGEVVWEHGITTEADGRFRFSDVPAHGLTLFLHVQAGRRPVLDEPGLSAHPGGVLDLGDLVLSVGGGLRGRVVDELGNPIADAEVRWTRSWSAEWAWLLRTTPGELSAVTNAAGEFFAEGLPPGELRLCARSANICSSWSQPQRVTDGQVLEDVELIVDAGRPLLGELVGPEGEPLAGSILAWPNGEGVQLTGESGADGRFALPGARPGVRYNLTVGADGYRTRFVQRVRVPRIEEPEDSTRIELWPAIDVLAVVRDASTGAPIPGAELAWAGQRGLGGMGGPEQNGLRIGSSRILGTTDTQGFYELAGVEDVSRSLVARAPGYAPSVARLNVQADDPDLAQRRVELALVAGGQLSVRVSDLLGAVQDAQLELRQVAGGGAFGSPASSSMPDPHNLRSPLLARAKSDENGEARFLDLPQDRYVLTAVSEAHGRVTSQRLEIGGAVQTYDLDLFLPRAASFEGRVLVRDRPMADQIVVATPVGADYGPGGRPPLSFSTSSDADGVYALVGLPPGSYELLAMRGTANSALAALLDVGARPERERIATLSLGEGEQRVVDLEGESDGLSLTGTLFLNHEARGGLLVRAERIVLEEGDAAEADKRWFRSAKKPSGVSDAEGVYELNGLQPGHYNVYVTRENQRSWGSRLVQAEIEMHDDTDAELDLYGMTTLLELSWELSDPNAPTPRFVRVNLMPDIEAGGVPGFPDEQRWPFTVGLNGVKLGDVPEGEYRASASARGLRSVSQSLSLRGGVPTELVFPMQPMNSGK